MKYEGYQNTGMDNSLKISEDVLATIAQITAGEIEGVAGLATTAAQGIQRLLGKKGKGNGISLQYVEDEAVIDLYIILKFGVRIPEVAAIVQERVKEAIQNMTNITVSKINVHVSGLVFGAENKKKK